MPKKPEATREQLRDERDATLEHICVVRQGMQAVGNMIVRRGKVHDRSKLSSEELPYFAIAADLKKTAYGTKAYDKSLRDIKPALKSHYAKNRHHPQFFKNGMAGMNLVDITEMIVDWHAAGKRHAEDHDIFKSINHNRMRFRITKLMASILWNTAIDVLGEEPERGYEMTLIKGCCDCGLWFDWQHEVCPECESAKVHEV